MGAAYANPTCGAVSCTPYSFDLGVQRQSAVGSIKAARERPTMEMNNILVIVDPTANEHPAVEKAARIAEKFRARVELYACETKESRALRYAAHLERGGNTDFIAHIRAVLDAVAQPLRKRGIDASVEVET